MQVSRASVIAVVVVIIATATAHGVVSQRWLSAASLTPVIPPIPMAFGDWIGSEAHSDLDDPNMANLTRKYVHKTSGRWFIVSVTAGHPGLTAVHTPEYCYRGSGYELTAPIATRATPLAGGRSADFFTTEFQKQTVAGLEKLRIFWSWSGGAGWKAPQHPRLAFVGHSSIYKLYIVGPGQAAVAPGADPALDEFLDAVLAMLDRALFAEPAA